MDQTKARDCVVIGMFDRQDDANAVVRDLQAQGIPMEAIELRNEQIRDDRGFFQKLGDVLSGRDTNAFSEGVRRGGTVVSVHVRDHLVDDAVRVMQDHDAIDIDERSSEWRAQGWTEPEGLEQGRDVSIPVVEEDVRVGKREVRRGGVRVYSHVYERPVEEQVQLREEHVHVDRRPVNRPADADEDLFKEQEFELTERAEEVVIAKEARIVEEVVVGKEVDTHTETVRDTVRRTEVDVEPIQDFEQDWRDRYAARGGSYDDYAPAYRHGYGMASQHRGRPWEDIEPSARQSWESNRPGTWEQFKDAIRHGWRKGERGAR